MESIIRCGICHGQQHDVLTRHRHNYDLKRRRPFSAVSTSKLVWTVLFSTVFYSVEAFLATHLSHVDKSPFTPPELRSLTFEQSDQQQNTTSSINSIQQVDTYEDIFLSPQQEDPFEATGQQELIKTLAGGPALIFEMARKSILFVQDVGPVTTTATRDRIEKRWRPYSGVSDNNPSFRTQAPAMNNQGFAKSIWRNVRKRNKPSQWRHALRTYERMTVLERETDFPHIERSNTHHEGAMLACAKLGLWQQALEIYHYVNQQEEMDRANDSKATRTKIKGQRRRNSANRHNAVQKKKRVRVTDDMVLSLIKACVRASRNRSKMKPMNNNPIDNNNGEEGNHHQDLAPTSFSSEIEEREAILRRIPLDTAYEVLVSLPKDHNIPMMAYLVNPLAAAYQSLGYIQEARDLLQTMLSNRTAGEDELFNVNDLHAKDKGSYSLLVQGAVVTGDWGSAVVALRDMNKAGLYPTSRHCNLWSEISERHSRPRAAGSWKKKRDVIWTDSVR